jgi:putative aldouronate transport system substrate-binding protein
MMFDAPLTRRSALKAAAVAAAALPAATACSSGKKKPETGQGESNKKVKLPTYTPYAGVTPDLPGTEDGGLPGFLQYPKSPPRAISGKPASGGEMTQLVPITSGLPPTVDKNKYWQEINSRLGMDLKLQMVPDGQGYTDKLTTLLASGDLPDALCIEAPSTQPNIADIAAHELADLSEFLAGDAAKDYPFLANLPTESWASTVFNGKIYGVPIPRGVFSSITFVRKDLAAAKSLNPKPANFDEFRKLCQGLTDQRANKWGIDRPAAAMQIVINMLGKPNPWAEKDGAFTSQYETDEYRQALSSVLTLVKDKVFQPDGITASAVTGKQWFRNGTVALFTGGYKGWLLDIFAGWPDQDKQVDGLVEPGYDGGPGTHRQGAPLFSMTSLKSADQDRIKQILSVCNWMAAPFGTEEYLLRKYGVADVDYTLNGTDPSLTKQGESELLLPDYYVADSPDVVYAASQPDNVKVIHDYLAEEAKIIVPDPTLGLYSPTTSNKGSSLNKPMTDFQVEYFNGRKSLDDWDDLVKTWRKNGGDTIRKEYEDAYTEANS